MTRIETPRIMPGTTVTFDVNLPPELERGIEHHVNSNLDLLPVWLIKLFVKWDPAEKPGCIASVTPNLAYRRAYVAIEAAWPDNDERSRDETIVHEFLHVHSWPLVQVARDMADMIEKNFSAPVVADRFRDEINTANEQVTSDLTELVLRLLKRDDSARDDAGVLTSTTVERTGPAIEHGRKEEP
jgi:hypothetical protein